MSTYSSNSAHVEDASSRGASRRAQADMALDQQSKRACLDRAGKENLDEGASLDKMRLLVPTSSVPPAHPTSPNERQACTNHASKLNALRCPPPTTPPLVYVNIDNDPDDCACAEYAEDIFAHLRHSETLRRPLTTYMESVQTDINAAMRAILVDWLVEVGLEYRLASDTLYLSIAYIDRFLSLVDVKRNMLQLVGVTSMLVASKYEEIYAPQVEEFCYITDNTYPKEKVISQERELLAALDFDLTQPTTKTFLRRFIKAAAGEINVTVSFEFLVSYLGELTLMEYSLLSYLPSHVAASCILVALFYMGKTRWSNTLLRYSGYTPAELKHCAHAIHSLFLGARTSALPASRDKYSSTKLGQVSLLRVADTLPESLFQPW